ncbi:MAG: hypothetical protein GX590_00720 [Lentisphaerae bacterium]|nr:hypothetical protein [Lentisphaerota bacterium]
MSFERQRTTFTCGPASLRYALSLQGMGLRQNTELSERDLRLVIPEGFSWRRCRYGFEDSDLRFAARRLGLKAVSHPYHKLNPDRFMRDLTRALERGRVCLCTWHSEKVAHFHWVCVAGAPRGGRMIVFDPLTLDSGQEATGCKLVDAAGRYAPGSMTQLRFRKWITPGRRLDVDGEYHFFMELFPDRDHADRFVPGMIDFRLLAAMRRDFDICSRFDEYIDDLRTIFRPALRARNTDDAHLYLVKQRSALERMVGRWTLSAACPQAFYRNAIASLIDISRCYRFRLSPGRGPHPMADLSFYLAWRACEYAYRVGPCREA